MTARPTVAVVILNYNYARFVGEAIGSALAQCTPFDQLLVVNDGSTDDSMAVIGAHAGSVEVLDIANRGQLGAGLAALDRLRTDYVHFLDADDLATPELVAEVREVLAAAPAKVQFQLTGMDESGQPLDSVFPTYPPGYDAAQMREDNQTLGFYLCPPTSANVFSVAALRQLDASRLQWRAPLDGTPALVMPYLGEVVSLNRPLARYRVHGSSDSQHSRPTPEVLDRDRERFARQWGEAERLVPGLRRPPTASTLFEAELALNRAALGESRPTPRVVWQYVKGVGASRFDSRRKVLLTGWAAAVGVAGTHRRRRMVYARRSPVNRSGPLQKAVSLVLHRGRTSPRG